MEGKLHSMSSLLSSFARSTLFTKMTTCRDQRQGSRLLLRIIFHKPTLAAVRAIISRAGLPSQCCDAASHSWCQGSDWVMSAGGWLQGGTLHLVEVQRVQQVVQLPVLLLLLPAAGSRCSAPCKARATILLTCTSHERCTALEQSHTATTHAS